MIMVESEGNDSAYHKREKAAGCLQIRPIMVREVNRILGIQKSELEYTLEKGMKELFDKYIEHNFSKEDFDGVVFLDEM